MIVAEVDVELSRDELLSGLKHFRSLAKQDLLRAATTDQPGVWRRHAEARQEIYRALTRVAESESPSKVVGEALSRYREVPRVPDALRDRYVRFVGEEHALENIFRLVGLEPRVWQEPALVRPTLVLPAATES